MNDTEKLLRAFIEASGFKVENHVDYKEEEVSKEEGLKYLPIISSFFGSHQPLTKSSHRSLITVDGNEFKRGNNDSYFTKLKNPEISYKVTKPVPYELIGWNDMTNKEKIMVIEKQLDELRRTEKILTDELLGLTRTDIRVYQK